MLTAARLSAVLLVAALTATMVPKALLTEFNATEDQARLERDIARRLEDRGFSVTRRAEISRPATFYAQRADCRVMIRHATDPAGFDRKYRQNARAIGMLRYRIGSKSYDAPPLLDLWVAEKLHQAKIRLGIGDARAAALAIAMNADCPPDALSTDDLLIHPQASS